MRKLLLPSLNVHEGVLTFDCFFLDQIIDQANLTLIKSLNIIFSCTFDNVCKYVTFALRCKSYKTVT